MACKNTSNDKRVSLNSNEVSGKQKSYRSRRISPVVGASTQITIGSETINLNYADSVTLIRSNGVTNGTSGPTWSTSSGQSNSGNLFRKDNSSAKDYGRIVTSGTINFNDQAYYLIEVVAGGGNSGGDSTGGGGGGGFSVYYGVLNSGNYSYSVGLNLESSTFNGSGINISTLPGGSGGGGGCSTNGPGGSGGTASGGNIINVSGQTGGQGSTACGGCSSGGGGSGVSTYNSSTFYSGKIPVTFPSSWGAAYGGTCDNGTIRYIAGGGAQAGGDNAGGTSGAYGLIRITYFSVYNINL